MKLNITPFTKCLFGVLCSLIASNAHAAPPTITSSNSEVAVVGAAYSYSITTDTDGGPDDPLGYSYTGGPGWLSFDNSTGELTGTPTIDDVGVYTFDLSAFNADGSSPLFEVTLTVFETAAAPVFTSPTLVTGIVGQPFEYTATADTAPISWSIINLNSYPGLSFDPSTGVISGTPTDTADGSVLITASNAFGNTGTGGLVELIISEAPVPVVTSPLTASGQQGVAFSYSITATNSPEAYGALGLAAIPGLSLSPSGEISGTPTVFGIFNLEISADNEFGTSGSYSLELTIDKESGDPPVPEITSSAIINVELGDPLAYQIEADGNPTGFSAPGIGAIDGLSIDTATGLISGTPTEAGSFNITLRATNAAGTGTLPALVVVSENEAPDVAISSPLDGFVIPAGNTVSIEITASDIDGFLTSVVLLANNVPIGDAIFVSDDIYSIELPTTNADIGIIDLTVKATDDQGVETTSPEVSISVIPAVVQIEIIDPATDQEILAGESITFTPAIVSSNDISSVRYLLNNSQIADISDSPFTYELTLENSGTFEVNAVAVDSFGNESAVSNTIMVSVNQRNALLRDEDFLRQTYQDLFGRDPSEIEIADGVLLLDGSIEARASFLADLITSNAAENVEIATMIYRTMTAEWPGMVELEEALDALSGASSGLQSLNGTIASSTATQTFPVSLPAGATISASVTADNSNSSGLNDATLTVFGPNGNFLFFDDDSGPGLDPLITFTTGSSGAYTFTVGGFGSNVGDFILTVTSSSSGGGGIINGNALVQELIPEYEARFGALNTSQGFVTQLFENKHLDVSPLPQSLVRLFNALTGGTALVGETAVPGYNGDTLTYITQFALDNDKSPLYPQGVGGSFLSRLHLYSMPNHPADYVPFAHAVAALFRVIPLDSEIEAYQQLGLVEALELMLTDPRYYERFDGSTKEALVAQYMATFGVFEPNEIGLDDDPDADGFTNEEEYDAGTDPTDPLDFPAVTPISMEDAVEALMQEHGEFTLISPSDDADNDGLTNLEEFAFGQNPVDPSSALEVNFGLGSAPQEAKQASAPFGEEVELGALSASESKVFTVTFVRLKELAQPDGMTIVAECSEDLVHWVEVSAFDSEIVPVADQSGLGPEYERVELRVTIDPETQNAMFFRVAVKTD